MVYHSCLIFKIPPPWIVFLAPFLIFMGFLGSAGYLFSIFLTSTVLILSTLFFVLFSKQKPVVLVENFFESKPQQENENIETNIEAADDHQQGISPSSSGLSESGNNQCLDQLSISEDSEVDWPFGDSVAHGDDGDQSPDYSDGSISDEDSLIEIALPSGHYVGPDHHYKEEIPTFTSSLQQKVPDLLPAADSIFKQRSLMELLAEINEMYEEDNLIEIDISMGSIKCSRFEIQA